MLNITISRRSAFIIALAILMVVPLAAFAGSVFDDVDDTDTHIEGITFMKDSGVSVGCDADNNYCPQDNVTRAQMGTFMYRLSGNDPATPPSVTADHALTADSATNAANADALAGQGPLAYTTQIDGMSCIDAGGCADPIAASLTEVLALPITVPASGVASLSYSVSGGASPAATNPVQTWLTLNDSSCGGWFFFPLDALPGTYANLVMEGNQTLVSLSGETVIEAPAGNHTISLCVLSLNDAWDTIDGHVTSAWSASGSGSALSSSSLAVTENIEQALSN